ncbi:F-box/LRR-repeat protein 17-like [Andrographis paniculata]|uniref:F-box/LRR-repeat protein 17-like n=1 Tax=Andrographis paniculata TaxID=175694 RepID=UPI0021E77686|nr:F-box/LRR-repeat protein 17-like [Andrographis paniculata]
MERYSRPPMAASSLTIAKSKKRGSYNCRLCGLPKKGHKCLAQISLLSIVSTPSSFAPSLLKKDSVAARRQVTFGEVTLMNNDKKIDSEGDFNPHGLVTFADELENDLIHDLEEDFDDPNGGLPTNCLRKIFEKLPPAGVLSAGGVCKSWREASLRIWRDAEELRIKVPKKKRPMEFIGSVLQKCPELLRLSLFMESDFDATMLACIAFSCFELQTLDISMSPSSINRITGDELSLFVSEERSLTTLKLEGCSNLRGFDFTSSSLETIWLYDLHSISQMIFSCPNLREIALDFCCQEKDTTDLTSIMANIGWCCPKLQNIHIASTLLSNSAVKALSSANLRELRMLSLLFGSNITDVSVAAITSSFPNLELLDLSGSSITDSGIAMICHILSKTLSKLLLALCHNITSSGIQFATGQLPSLELLDCGKTLLCDHSERSSEEKIYVLSPVYQKLFIKHSKLKKLSLWGCSGLDSLYIDCSSLIDLNLNSCENLHPERLRLQCPNLEIVDASNCNDILIKAIRNQVDNDISPLEDHISRKRMPDNSKRVGVPCYNALPCLCLCVRTYVDKECTRPTKRRRCQLLVDL